MYRQNTKLNLFGIPIDSMTMNETLAKIDQTIKSKRERLRIGVVNAAKIVNMRRNPTLRNDVLSSDIILADGRAVVVASRLLKKPLPERVAGIDLMMRLFEKGDQAGYRVFLLGAKETISNKVAKKIEEQYPGLIVAGRQNGYFSEEEEKEIADKIRISRPDILFVAISSPKKEKFMARWADKMNVPVIHGVGGSFDVYVGAVQRAPKKWQQLGLEWLYRLKQEPKRLLRRYLVTNTLFIAMVIHSFLAQMSEN